MATVPEIALGFRPPNIPTGMETLSQIGQTIGQWASVQNTLNQAKLFQQTTMARQRAGEILASSPNLEAAMEQLQKDEIVAPYLPEVMNSLRQSHLAMIQAEGSLTGLADTGLQTVMKAIPELMTNPSNLDEPIASRWDDVIASRMAVVSPLVRDRVGKAVDALKDSLMTGLPDDPRQARLVFNQRLSGKMLGAGFTPETIQGLVGTPTRVKARGFEEFGVTLPSQFGGAFIPQNAVPLGLEPQVTQGPGGEPIQVGGGDVPPVPEAIPGVQRNPLGAQSLSAGPNPGSAIGLTGHKILAPTELKMAEKLADEYAGDGAKEYQSAVNTLSSLTYMNNSLDEMAQTGGFLAPGSGAGFRAEIARGVNTMAQIAGIEPPFNPKTIATIEEFNKETTRMGLMVVNQMLGGQREAAQIILGITGSVPGVENTYLGGKLVARGLEAVAQRAIDYREFQNDWISKHQGNLVGSDVAFNKLHPPQDYAKRVLDEMGMTAKGFASKEIEEQAKAQGWLNSIDGGGGKSGKARRPLGEIFGGSK